MEIAQLGNVLDVYQYPGRSGPGGQRRGKRPFQTRHKQQMEAGQGAIRRHEDGHNPALCERRAPPCKAFAGAGKADTQNRWIDGDWEHSALR